MKDSKKERENLEWLISQPIKMQYELFKNYLEMAKLHYNQMLKEEEEAKTGEKYTRGNPYSRWGSNPGSIRIGSEKIPVRAPRFYDKEENRTEGSSVYQNLHNLPMPSEEVILKVIKGLSQRDYEEVTRSVGESFGISQSTISRKFIDESRKQIEKWEKRDLGRYDFIALFIDGKYLSKEQIVIALGITVHGDKIPLGYIQTTTENSTAIKGLLKDLIRRNFKFAKGILTLTDGSKGLIKGVKEVFGRYAIEQRCQWHKRENVVSHLNERDKELYRGKIQRAYNEPDYQTARERLWQLRDELKKVNISASRSLEEGLEETLTIHRLGLVEKLGRSFTTTNIIESLNSQMEKYLRKVKRWVSPEMKTRWVVLALIEIEKKMRRINKCKNLVLLREAIAMNIKKKYNRAA